MIVSDNGPQLSSEEVYQFLNKLEIQQKRVALYESKQNGLVERFNREIKQKLEEASKFGWNVQKTLENYLFHYRRART